MAVQIANSAPVPLGLSGLELTGRASTHVREVPELRCLLHPLAAAALQAMRAAAALAGIDLVPVSGFRDFARQLAIWNEKFSGARPLLDRAGEPLAADALATAGRVAAILVWSALPCASRHHLGSDCDLIDRAALSAGAAVELLGKHYGAGGFYAALAAWLKGHAHDYGFFLPYDIDRGGGPPGTLHYNLSALAGPAQAAPRPEALRAGPAGQGLSGLGGRHARTAPQL